MPDSDTAAPFDDIRDLMRTLPEADAAAVAAVRARERELTKPAGALGRLEELAEWLAGWQGRAAPAVTAPQVAIFAANHGVARHGVSAYPVAVTQQMMENFAAGGAAINQISAAHNAGLKVFDLALDLPTPDITETPAMSEMDCAATIAFGMEAIAGGTDLLCLGEMGIGNTTIASAICCALYGGAIEDWVGHGTGIDAAGLARKIDVIRRALATHAQHLTDPLEILRHVGGREVAAMVGAIIAARSQRIPVLLDGFVVCAAAAIVQGLNPAGLDHCVAAHRSAEAPHGRLLEKLGKMPLLDLGMRLGEGSGAALAIPIVATAAAIHGGMATFAQAGVTRAEKAD